MRSLIEATAAISPEVAKKEKRLNRLLQRNETGQTPASLPETFDIIEATGNIKSVAKKLPFQTMIVERLRKMRPGPSHRALATWALNSQVPLLTTNYEHCLQDALGEGHSKKWKFGIHKHSDYYPWNRYYAPHKVSNPIREFAVWHIHGDQDLKRSIRAGLDQYMGMVQRLRRLKFKIAREILLGQDQNQAGEFAYHAAPWLGIFMGRKLWIQGLGLSSAEVSVRWLLIQRFRYWTRYKPENYNGSGWYIHGPTVEVGRLDDERRIFFESVGLQVIEIANRSDCYVNLFGEHRRHQPT